MVARVLDRSWKPRRLGEPQLADPLVGVERHTVPTAHGAVAAWRVGEGPAVLLVHGWQDDSSLWSPLMAALLDAGRAVAAFDLLAHGFSEGDRGLTFELVDAAHAVVDVLGPIDGVVAHSFAGGGCALAISEGLPADRLVLIAPPLWPTNATRFHRVAAAFGYPSEVGDRAREIYRATTIPSRADYDIRSRLADLDAAVLIVSSLDDEQMAVEDARTIAPMLRRGELFEVRGADHRGCAQDPVVIRRVVEFLAGDQISS
jgi:pimeloyl-ACP methyl ester carboxylesterase